MKKPKHWFSALYSIHLKFTVFVKSAELPIMPLKRQALRGNIIHPEGTV